MKHEANETTLPDLPVGHEPDVSLDDESIWDAGDCSGYLKVCRKHFLRDLRFREGFPKQLDWSLVGRPRWAARSVKAWALRQDYANNPEVVDS